MRTRVYVDGFNLYYAALKGTQFKWLNLVELARQVLPAGHTIDKLIYFTARVSGISDRGAPARQQIYLNALNTLPEVEVHFGSFLAKTAWRPVINLPVAGKQISAPIPVTLPEGNHPVEAHTLSVGKFPMRGVRKKKPRKTTKPLPNAVIAEVHTMEEKGSDVNLAAHLLNDAWKGMFEAAVVISNDTDLVTPISMVTTERKKPVFVICPRRRQQAPKLKNVASHVRHIHQAMLKAAQFPDRLPNTRISKPPGW